MRRSEASSASQKWLSAPVFSLMTTKHKNIKKVFMESIKKLYITFYCHIGKKTYPSQEKRKKLFRRAVPCFAREEANLHFYYPRTSAIIHVAKWEATNFFFVSIPHHYDALHFFLSTVLLSSFLYFFSSSCSSVWKCNALGNTLTIYTHTFTYLCSSGEISQKTSYIHNIHRYIHIHMYTQEKKILLPL